MTDKERRDKRFRKLCKWMSEAGEIAEILREECAQNELPRCKHTRYRSRANLNIEVKYQL